MQSKKIIILGATGQIGKELSFEFKNSDLDVICFTLSETKCNCC